MKVHDEATRQQAIDKIGRLNLESHAWEVTGKIWKKTRSNDQNSYLWGVVYPMIRQHIIDSTGDNFTSEEIHEAMMAKFLDAKPKIVLDEVVLVRSTKKLSTVEFIEYVGAIQQYFAEQGLIIPDPNEELTGG
jgi:hypothetical protein